MATKYLLLEKLSQSYPPFQTDEGYLYKYQYNTVRASCVSFIYLVLLPMILIWGWPEYMSLHRQIASALFYLGGYSQLFMFLYMLWTYLIPLGIASFLVYQIGKYLWLILYLKKYAQIIQISTDQIKLPKTLFSRNPSSDSIDYRDICKVTYWWGLFMPHSSHLFNTSQILIKTYDNARYKIETDFMSKQAIKNLEFLLKEKSLTVEKQFRFPFV